MATVLSSVEVGAIEVFMTQDHARLDGLLRLALPADGGIDRDVYEQFRRDLLRHIAMEEKVLLPYARAKRNGERLPVAKALRADHGEIARLLVPTPSPALIGALCALLGWHNRLEEGPGGLYALCDALAGKDGDEVVERLAAQPQVPVAPHYDGPLLNRT